MATPVTIPSLLLKQLYNFGSLENHDDSVQFTLKNRLTDTTVRRLVAVRINSEPVDKSAVTIDLGEGVFIHTKPDTTNPPSFEMPLGKVLRFKLNIPALEEGKHAIEVVFDSEEFGELVISVQDSIAGRGDHLTRVPRSDDDDYTSEAIGARQDFAREFTGTQPEHIFKYSIDPAVTKGNIELFSGVAQIPLGFAGPIWIRGEHAQGDFLVPLATTEGTLVASYNRGIKVINMSGGVRTTVVSDAMQRAPVFVFANALDAREFVKWVEQNMQEIREHAEATSSIAKLLYIDPYLTNKFVYLRFNFLTGDAAGQNMVGRATFAACSWIIDQYEGIRHFYLESNFATDKKASQVNIMHTRGKRVTAEVVIPREVLNQVMRVEPEDLHNHSRVATIGAFLSGANNNGAHSPNAITAIFIATGQDVANVSESSAGLLYTEMNADGSLYVSLTIPSLIVASYGGGTGLPTQRECLEIMGCYGKGKVHKLAEIIAGVALAGEISLGSAIASSDWVSSHEKYGRNR